MKNLFIDRQIDSMIRVNHAGEYAAKCIYRAQLAHIKDKDSKKLIHEMAKGEEIHLKYFEDEIVKRRVRPTILFPLVGKVSYAVGALTAMFGKESAMACTSAVEEVISDHYQSQIDQLDGKDSELKKKIIQFREEELEHKATAENYDLDSMKIKMLKKVIGGGCKAAIKLVRYL